MESGRSRRDARVQHPVRRHPCAQRLGSGTFRPNTHVNPERDSSTERLPAFHRLDVRVDRKFRMFGRSTSLFADIHNVYNHRSVIEYSWNQKTRELHAEKQLRLLPVIGINIEF
jgi:deoxycytidine triphosphate deaminase